MSTALKQLNPTRYRKLLSQVMPVAIETEEENERMLAVVEKLMDKGEDMSAEEEALLRLLTTLIQDFEEKYYQPGDASPLEVLRHLMEARGVKPKDLWELFGSKGVASEVLNGKRNISKAQAKKLAEFFGVSTDLFI
jgi:HTH-type transcriptional regulator/antitoxin HigA